MGWTKAQELLAKAGKARAWANSVAHEVARECRFRRQHDGSICAKIEEPDGLEKPEVWIEAGEPLSLEDGLRLGRWLIEMCSEEEDDEGGR